MGGHKRRLGSVVAGLTAGLGLAVMTGCSAGGHDGTAAVRPVPDPSTVAQMRERLLVSGAAPGFIAPSSDRSTLRSATAHPFTPPRGNTAQRCEDLMIPHETLRLSGLLSGSQDLAPADQKGYEEIPPGWTEWIDVYPGTEAPDIVAALPGLIGRCGSFMASNPGAGPRKTHVREAVAPLRGLGDQALYVGVWLPLTLQGKRLAADWVVIRSHRTLIWLEGTNLRDPSIGKQNPQTLLLAKNAWHQFSA